MWILSKDVPIKANVLAHLYFMGLLPAYEIWSAAKTLGIVSETDAVIRLYAPYMDWSVIR